MAETITNGKLTDLVTAYLAGDPDAVAIIDIAVDVAHTISWIRESPYVENYTEIRQDCDESVDFLLEAFERAEHRGWLSPPE